MNRPGPREDQPEPRGPRRARRRVPRAEDRLPVARAARHAPVRASPTSGFAITCALARTCRSTNATWSGKPRAWCGALPAGPASRRARAHHQADPARRAGSVAAAPTARRRWWGGIGCGGHRPAARRLSRAGRPASAPTCRSSCAAARRSGSIAATSSTRSWIVRSVGGRWSSRRSAFRRRRPSGGGTRIARPAPRAGRRRPRSPRGSWPPIPLEPCCQRPRSVPCHAGIRTSLTIRGQLERAGAEAAAMTGSGSTVFGLFQTMEAATAVAPGQAGGARGDRTATWRQAAG